MAKKTHKLEALTLTEIILRGDAETIRQALEARTKIDTLLEEREAAYAKIAELETQVCDIVGDEGDFPFPEPPMPVAEYPKAPAKAKAKPAPKPAPTEEAPETPEPVELTVKAVPEDSAPDEAPDTENK